MGLSAGDVYVNFKPRDQWRTASPEALVVKMDAVLKQVPGIDYNFTAPMAMRLDEAISGVRTELGVKVFGDDLAVLERTAREIRDVIATVPGAADTSVDVSAGAMQVELALDRNALSRYGLNVADVRDAVQTAVGGTHATEIIDGRKRIPVVVRLGEAYRGTPEAIGQLLITAPPGGRVTLSQVAQVRVVGGPELITHENAQRMIIVQSNVRGRDLGGFAADVQRQVAARVPLPPGYFVSYGGQFENQQRAMSRLALTAGRGGQRRLGDPFAAGVDDGARRELRVHPDGHRDDARLGSTAPAGDGRHRGTGELDRADPGGVAPAL
jgi:cobalt-zinc-cadmium resistance protein CzcA